MPFVIVRADIARLRVDAVVNAANAGLKPGSGVCGAIFSGAGYEQMEAACDALGGCPPGGAVITPGFGLPARYVIHTVGPVWQGGDRGEEALLAACYRSSLELARDRGLRSVAFPLISTGHYGFPRDLALSVAYRAIGDFLLEHDMRVILAVFDRDSFSLSTRFSEEIREYIDDHYVHARLWRRRQPSGEDALSFKAVQAEAPEALTSADLFEAAPRPPAAVRAPRSLPDGQAAEAVDFTQMLDDPFPKRLMALIDARGLRDAEVYKRANLDRKHFQKIRTGKIRPGQSTLLALCVALELDLDGCRELLALAGHSLSPASLSDVIVSYFIKRGIFDIYEINGILFKYGQPLLGSC